jgi:bla regulator protein BlaR1
MIASWMLYMIAASLLVTIAAFAIDRGATAMRVPTRFVWVAAMLLSVSGPIAAFVLAAQPQRSSTTNPRAVTVAVSEGITTAGASVTRAGETTLNIPVDRALLVAWALLSAILLMRLVQSVRSIDARERTWRTSWVDGVRVRVSSDIGPAVVGIGSLEIVLPTWALELDKELRHFVLLHEDEHRVARDPHLLLLAAALVIVMPWNLALLWQAKRLRLAIELDCDARVLRTHPDHERYGLLLLALAQRSRTRVPLVAAAMSEPALDLSRRIAAMSSHMGRVSRLRLAAYALTASVAIAAACAIDSPLGPSSRAVSFEPAVLDALEPGRLVERYERLITDSLVLATGAPEGAVVYMHNSRPPRDLDAKTLRKLSELHASMVAIEGAMIRRMEREHPGWTYDIRGRDEWGLPSVFMGRRLAQ